MIKLVQKTLLARRNFQSLLGQQFITRAAVSEMGRAQHWQAQAVGAQKLLVHNQRLGRSHACLTTPDWYMIIYCALNSLALPGSLFVFVCIILELPSGGGSGTGSAAHPKVITSWREMKRATRTHHTRRWNYLRDAQTALNLRAGKKWISPQQTQWINYFAPTGGLLHKYACNLFL